MALSKPLDVCDKIGKMHWCKPTEHKIHDEEIEIHCFHKQEKAISVELIQHMLGGLNMEYKVINIQDSFEAFDYSAKYLIDTLNDKKPEILFFEHRNNSTSSILVVVIKQKKQTQLVNIQFWWLLFD